MNPLFLKLLQPFPPQGTLECKEDDLAVLKSEAIKHNLVMLTQTQLKKYIKEDVHNDSLRNFMEEIKPLYVGSIFISQLQETIEKEIISLLNERGIPSVVIKGNTIAQEIYGEPNCRTSSDIDILIKRADAIQVDSILSKAGYISDMNMPLIYCLSHIHHASYYHPGTNILVEIHWGFGIPYFFNLDTEEIWNEVLSSDSVQQKLSPEMVMIMLLIHHHSHAFRRLKILVDILWALHKYEEVIEWHLFALRIKRIGLIKTMRITLNQIQSLWKEVTHEMKSLQALQQEIDTMGYKVPEFLLSYFQMDINKNNPSNIYKDKLFARFALDRWSTIILSYFKTLFPVPEAIKELYGDKRNWILPFNYFRFIKWRVKEWVSK